MMRWLERGAVSPTHAAHLKQVRLQSIGIYCTRILLLIVLLTSWEWMVSHRWLDPFLFSSPSRVFQEAVTLAHTGQLFFHIGITTLETLVGFAIGSISGILLATLIWFFPFLSRVLDPYLVVLNSMPKVALGPFFIVIMGTGFASVLSMAIAITIVITTLVVHTHFRQVSSHYIVLAKSLGATRLQIFRMIVFPASTKEIIGALKVNIGLSWVGVIVGEFLVSKAGLGYLIIYGFQVFNLHLVMLSLLIIAIISTGMYQLISYLEHRLSKLN